MPRIAASTRVNTSDAELRAHGQLELPTDGDRSLYASVWQRVLASAKEVVAEIGLKNVAYDLDTSKSSVEHALEERDRHRLCGEDLVYLQLRSRHPVLAGLVPGMRGFDLAPKRVLTPEERLERIEKRAATLGAPIQRFLFDDDK